MNTEEKNYWARGEYYVVEFTIVVTHPERRNHTFKPVVPGYINHQVFKFKTWRGALTLYNEIMAGGWDFPSEYVSKIQVWRSTLPHKTMRRLVERPCPEKAK